MKTKNKITSADLSIRLETGDKEKYLQAEGLVKKIAKEKGRGPKSNLDLCYYLDDEKKAGIVFKEYYLNTTPRAIEMTASVDSHIINEILDLLYKKN
jgi:hypothetical protein